MKTVSYKNPTDGKDVVLAITNRKPCDEITDFLDTANSVFCDKNDRPKFHALVRTVNSALKECACDEILESENAVKSLLSRVTFGKYNIEKSATGVDVVTYVFPIEKPVTVKGKAEMRPVFITYEDIVRRVADINRHNKKHNIPTVSIDGDFTGKDVRVFRWFIAFMCDELTDLDKSQITAKGEKYKPLLGDRHDRKNFKPVAQILYDHINAHTGLAITALPYIPENIATECKKYSSMLKCDRNTKDIKWFSTILNEYINSDLAIGRAGKPKKSETTATADSKPNTDPEKPTDSKPETAPESKPDSQPEKTPEKPTTAPEQP